MRSDNYRLTGRLSVRLLIGFSLVGCHFENPLGTGERPHSTPVPIVVATPSPEHKVIATRQLASASIAGSTPSGKSDVTPTPSAAPAATAISTSSAELELSKGYGYASRGGGTPKNQSAHHYAGGTPHPPSAEAKPEASATPNQVSSPKDTLPPWFPPKATSEADLSFLLAKICEASEKSSGNDPTIGALDRDLTSVLSHDGYEEVSHYWLEGDNPGFAIITRFEFIDDLGLPVEAHRFETQLPPVYWYSGWDAIKSIVFPNPGRYRLIAFVIAQNPIEEKEELMSRAEVEEVDHGPNGLSNRDWIDLAVTPRFHFTAYVYEFYRQSRSDPVTYRTESDLSALKHLASIHFVEDMSK